MAGFQLVYGALRSGSRRSFSAFAVIILSSGTLAADTLYVVAKVSVDATDKDAVAAKAKAWSRPSAMRSTSC